MASYTCKIAGKDGTTVEKTIQADSTAALARMVARDGGFLIQVEKSSPGKSVGLSIGRHKPGLKDFFSFNHEFLALLGAGIPVVMALDGIVENNEKKYFSRVLLQIRDDISDGESLSNAFEKHVPYFSPLYIATLRSGEAAGNIPDAIEKYLEYLERSQAIREKIRSAAIYPAILTVCSLAVVTFLLVFVVPAITGTFVESGADLPVFTRWLLQFSDFIRSWFPVILIGSLLIFLVLSLYRKTDSGRYFFDTWWLKLPFVGNLSVIYATALFSSSLSTILAGGTPLNRALYIANGLIQNRRIHAGIERAIHRVEDGESFAGSLKVVQVFPDMALRMIRAGEEGGRLEKVLSDLSRFYEKEVANTLTMIASTIEPALMVAMGFVIGFIMLAMYVPIFQMAGTIG
ncbi:MAG: type II secretion system F family protein [Desulfotignum sp.]